MPSKSIQIDSILKVIPTSSGVYQYFDKTGKIIYVGKAKNLKNRVKSYFSKKTFQQAKTKVLVSKIEDIKYIVTPTEHDALLLENTLIKKHRPKYNIQLKDDKTYPWICIKNEPFPRVFATRNLIKDKSEYFGPYNNAKIMHALLDMIKELYPLRSCSHKLSEENIAAGKFKVCLEYHIKNCLGGCEGHELATNYETNIVQIRKILKGRTKEVLDYLKAQMLEAAEAQDFENAQLLKDKLMLLQKYKAKCTVVNPNISNVEVYTIVSDSDMAFVNTIKIIGGAIVGSYTSGFKKKLGESDEEVLTLAIIELRTRLNNQEKELYLPFELDLDLPGIKLTVPQIGDKKELIKFSLRNAKQFKFDHYKTQKIVDPERHSKRIMEQLKKDLRLTVLPKHIECFDNSNFQGTNAVAACVVFKDAKPSKKEYRHFNIKTVTGPDDFASMEEVVYRRYKRLKEEKQPLPQLIVVDGGKGQLSSAVKALRELDLFGTIAIVGIAKRLEEIFFPGDSIPLYIDKKSESLKTLQHLRNEAHRFGITHHRNKRSKNALMSELEEIPGIGPSTIKQLLEHFKFTKNVKTASLSELLEVVNTKKAKAIRDFFS